MVFGWFGLGWGKRDALGLDMRDFGEVVGVVGRWGMGSQRGWGAARGEGGRDWGIAYTLVFWWRAWEWWGCEVGRRRLGIVCSNEGW